MLRKLGFVLLLLLLVFGPVARMLHIVTALAQAVVVIGLAVVVLLLLAAG